MSNSQSFVPGPDTSRQFRDALGKFATGVTVITTKTETGVIGITANSFSSVSLTPALVLWSPAKASDRYPYFVNAPYFAIHVLRADQQALATAFANSGTSFAPDDWATNAHGVPVLNDCLAHFECRLVARHDAGDHDILVGEVEHATQSEGTPLVFQSGRFGQLQP